MTDVVERVLTTEEISASELFKKAYEDTPCPDNYTWAKDLYFRSGFATRTVEAYCKKKLNARLPHDFPDNYAHLAGALK
jgi:hypothetical protein